VDLSRIRLTVFVLALGVLMTPVQAQQPVKIPRVGYLSPVGRATGVRTFDAFRRGLGDLGYIDGKNIEIAARFAETQYERIPQLTRELVALRVDVIAVQGAVTVRGARQAAGDVPIVFAVVVDPVEENLVTNLEHPGGNVTGVTTLDPQQPRKQLELLKEVIPGLKRVAFLGDQGVSEALMNASEAQVRALGIQSQRHRVSGPAPDLEGVFAAIQQEQAGALVALEEPVVGITADRIAALALKYRIPAMCAPLRSDAGFLLAYGTSLADGMRGMAPYVDKILKGVKPGDLPVQALTNYELTVNLKTARALSVAIPPEVLKRANHVIQ